MPKSPVSFAIRKDILQELMLDKVYAEKLTQAEELYEIIEVIQEFAEKKGYKFTEIYV